MLQMVDQLVQKAQRQRLSGELEELRKNHSHHDKDNYYRFLYYLVEATKPAVALELGVDFGVGSAHMVAAAKEYGGLVIGIDIQDKGERIRDLGKNYWFIKDSTLADDTRRILQMVVDNYGPVGLVYQDSSHHYQESHQEWAAISPFCKPGAIWICDDITPSFHDPDIDPPGKGMIQYFAEIPRPRKKLYKDILHYGNCQGVVIV